MSTSSRLSVTNSSQRLQRDGRSFSYVFDFTNAKGNCVAAISSYA